MTYNQNEISIASSRPYFLYEFNTKSITYRYTNYSSIITQNDLAWNPLAITHTEAKQSSEMSKNAMTITLPITGEFASLFIGWAPDEIVTFTLYRGHFGSSATRVNWKGRISGHTLKNEVLELNCESIFTSMRRAGIRARYQRSCRHALYSSGCNLNKDNFANTNLVITGFDGTTLTIRRADNQADGYYLGGLIKFSDGSYRTIEQHVGTAITIDRSSRIIIDAFTLSENATLTVTLYPGCDRTIATCKNKFNNLLNNGSFNWIPVKNPMGGSSII